MAKYRTSPDHDLTGWPKGVKYIVGNEGCERFSYYGMNAILYIYCASLFISHSMPEEGAKDLAVSTVHLFKAGVYALPMIGAIIADRWLGKYNTIFWLSLVYCLGHAVLSIGEGSMSGLAIGLGLIAIGSGGIKPCVSAHVGDQFGRSNWFRLERVYQIFYFIINFGSFFAVLTIPLVQKYYGFRIAFLIPGVLMLLATWIFWLGRKDFVHIPATPGGKLGLLDTLSSTFLFLSIGSCFFTASFPWWVILTISVFFLLLGIMLFSYRQRISKDDGFLAICIYILREWMAFYVLRRHPVMILANSGQNMVTGTHHIAQGAKKEFGDDAVEGAKAVIRIISVFFMVSIFWALFDQHSSSWIRQATMMNLIINLPLIGNIELLASQIPSLNPVMVMLLIPFWAYVIEPFFQKFGIFFKPLKKMSLGMALASISFVSVAILQDHIDKNPPQSVSVLWQIIPYLLITLSEILVSITGLEFAYSQAPTRMKSTVMGFWLLTVSLGNIIVALLAHFSGLSLVDFFWLFAGLMGLAAFIFAIRAYFYKIVDYTQK